MKTTESLPKIPPYNTSVLVKVKAKGSDKYREASYCPKLGFYERNLYMEKINDVEEWEYDTRIFPHRPQDTL